MDTGLGVLRQKAEQRRGGWTGQPGLRPGVEQRSDVPLMNGRHRRAEQDDTWEELTPGAAELPADLTDGHTVVAQLSPRDHAALFIDDGLQRWQGEHQDSIGRRDVTDSQGGGACGEWDQAHGGCGRPTAKRGGQDAHASRSCSMT